MAQSEETQGSILWSGIALGGAAGGLFLAKAAGTGAEAFALEKLMTHQSVTELCAAGREDRKGREQNGSVSS